jgi:putative transposase
VAFGDESGFTENPPPCHAWAPKGAPHAHEMKTGTRQRLNAIGCCGHRLDPQSVWFFEGRVRGVEFRRWAASFAASCDPARPTHLWLDNGPVHTSKATRACFEGWLQRGLMIHFLPPYCPELNRVEIMWRIMKRLRPFQLLEQPQLRSVLKAIVMGLRKIYGLQSG